jgi:hypothetical protein
VRTLAELREAAVWPPKPQPEPWTIEKARAYALEVGDDERAAGALNDALSWAIDLLEWRPIETAPHNDHPIEGRIQVWEPDGGSSEPKTTGAVHIVVWRRQYEPDGPEGFWVSEMDDEPVDPTHWRPIGPGPGQ